MNTHYQIFSIIIHVLLVKSNLLSILFCNLGRLNKWKKRRQNHDLAAMLHWESDTLVVSNEEDIRRVNDLISKKLGGDEIIFEESTYHGERKEIITYTCKTKKCKLSLKWGLIGLQKSSGPQWYLYDFTPHTLQCFKAEKESKCTGDKDDTCPYSVDKVAEMIEDILLHNPRLENHTLAAHLKAIVRAKGDQTSFQGGHGRFPVSCAAIHLKSFSLSRYKKMRINYHFFLINFAGI